MAVTDFSPLLGLALPTTGDLSGTWGTTVNEAITGLLDSAVAGTTTLSADTDVTLSTTNGAANQARSAVILWTASNGATTRNITAPARSKAYVVINAGTGSVVIRGTGPTTGVTVLSGRRSLVVWNGSDFVEVAGGLVNLATGVTGTLPIANGGTGETTRQAAIDALAGAVTSGQYLRGNGTDVVMSALQAADVTGAVAVANGGTSLTTLTANNVILGNGTSAPLFVAPGTSGNVLTSTGTTWASSTVPAGGLTYVVKTANYTASDKEGVLADTSGGAFTVTLPATPATGAQVVVADSGNAWGTNNLTVGRNGSTIGGLAENLVCDITGVSVQLVYDGTTWEVYAQIGGQGGSVVTLDGTQTLTNKTLTDPKLLLGGTNGTAGQVPISQGTGLAPVWGAVGGGGAEAFITQSTGGNQPPGSFNPSDSFALI